MTQDDTVWEFPCEFPIKVMGRAGENFKALIIELVSKHVSDLDESKITAMASKQGNYISLTVTITATSKEQLDRIYLELNANDAVLMTL
jgi:putative lipoic acid-binding regulatory protein